MKTFKFLGFFVAFVAAACLAAQAGPSRKESGVQAEPAPTGHPFILDSQRILLEASFERADGGARSALVWFNMGIADPILSDRLYQELAIGRRETLKIRIGDVEINAPAGNVIDGDGGLALPDFHHLFAPRLVEAMLPASLLKQYAVTIDYGRKRLFLNNSGRGGFEGVRVPASVNPRTGVVAVEAEIDGSAYPIAIDAGSGYTWMRGDVSRRWLETNPSWRRVDGAVGQANANMVDYSFEKDGEVFRIPRLKLGGLALERVGALGTAPLLGSFADSLFGDLFWDNWAKAAPTPVIGWLGGNALQDFKLTIDYPNQTTYWLRQRPADARDLNQVGVTLVRRGDRYFIGGVVRLPGTNRLTVDGLQPGEELASIDGRPVRGLGKDAVLSALHGRPGDTRLLLVEGSGGRREIEAAIIDLE
jgi:hypothetical protein